jgi:broad specificity phosphatase PhoE
MSKWLRKTLPLTVDMRFAERYAGAWQGNPVPEWLASQPSLLQAHCQTDL